MESYGNGVCQSIDCIVWSVSITARKGLGDGMEVLE